MGVTRQDRGYDRRIDWTPPTRKGYTSSWGEAAKAALA